MIKEKGLFISISTHKKITIILKKVTKGDEPQVQNHQGMTNF